MKENAIRIRNIVLFKDDNVMTNVHHTRCHAKNLPMLQQVGSLYGSVLLTLQFRNCVAEASLCSTVKASE